MDTEFIIDKHPERITYLNRTVHHKHFEAHPDVFEPYNYQHFLSEYTSMLKRKDTIGIIIKQQNRYIGYAILVHQKIRKQNPFIRKDHEVLYVDQMSIDPPYQHQGIGTQLFEFIKGIAREKGIRKIQLDVWVDNLQARNFYTKMGFHTQREIMEYLVED